MNILFLACYYPPHVGGGAEVMLQIHAEGFCKRGHNVTVVCLTNENRIIYDIINEITVIRVPIRNIYWPLGEKPGKLGRLLWHLIDSNNWRYKEPLKAIINQVNPDVAICENLQGWSTSVWKIFNKADIPVVQVVHDYNLICSNANMYKGDCQCQRRCIECKLIKYYNKRFGKSVSHFVYVSNSVRNQFERFGFTKGFGSVVYNAKPMVCTHKKTIWDGSRELIIGFIGTLAPSKGVMKLIEAFKSTTINSRLLIAGKPKSKDFEIEILESISSDSRIEYLGYTNSNLFFEKIDLAIFPSLWSEPFGLVAVEACAHQVPCIVSSYGGLSEIIKENINGFYCDPSDTESIARRIIQIYDNPGLLYRLICNTHNSISPFVNVATMIERLECICNDAIKNFIIK